MHVANCKESWRHRAPLVSSLVVGKPVHLLLPLLLTC
jgi:hypothetical protein